MSLTDGNPRKWRRGWNLDLLVGIRGLKLYTEYPHRLFLVVGPWAITLGPWSRSSRYGNGSHWHSGWHRWREQVIE
jgi:hypothetical protein